MSLGHLDCILRAGIPGVALGRSAGDHSALGSHGDLQEPHSPGLSPPPVLCDLYPVEQTVDVQKPFITKSLGMGFTSSWKPIRSPEAAASNLASLPPLAPPTPLLPSSSSSPSPLL